MEKTEYKPAGRVEWIDVLRAIAMYLVVIGHATDSGGPGTYRYYIYSFHMPLFFIISGCSYYLQTSKKEYTFSAMLENKARALVWPYFTLNLIDIIPWYIIFKIISDSNMTMGELFQGLFYSNENWISAPSNATWFLPTLFLTAMVFYMVQKWSKGNEQMLVLAVLVITSFGYSMSMRTEAAETPWHIETVPIALLFFLLGYMLMKYFPTFEDVLGGWKRRIIWIALGLGAGYWCATNNVRISMASNNYGSFILFLGSALGYSLAFLIIALWIPKLKILKFIGRNTIVFLAFHTMLFRFMERYSETTNLWKEQNPVIIGTVSFLLMIPLAWVFDRFFPVLIGKKKVAAKKQLKD